MNIQIELKELSIERAASGEPSQVSSSRFLTMFTQISTLVVGAVNTERSQTEAVLRI